MAARNDGFSLLEILVALVVVGAIVMVVFSFVNSGFAFLGQESSQTEIQENIRLAENLFNRELRNARYLKIGGQELGSIPGEDDSTTSVIKIVGDGSGNYYLKQDDHQVTETIFSEIKLSKEKDEENIIELKMYFSGRDPYSVEILLNNFVMDKDIKLDKSLTEKISYVKGD